MLSATVKGALQPITLGSWPVQLSQLLTHKQLNGSHAIADIVENRENADNRSLSLIGIVPTNNSADSTQARRHVEMLRAQLLSWDLCPTERISRSINTHPREILSADYWRRPATCVQLRVIV